MAGKERGAGFAAAPHRSGVMIIETAFFFLFKLNSFGSRQYRDGIGLYFLVT